MTDNSLTAITQSHTEDLPMSHLDTSVARLLKEAEAGRFPILDLDALTIVQELPVNESVALFMRDCGDYFFVYLDNNDASEGFHAFQLYASGELRLMNSFDNFDEAASCCLATVICDREGAFPTIKITY